MTVQVRTQIWGAAKPQTLEPRTQIDPLVTISVWHRLKVAGIATGGGWSTGVPVTWLGPSAAGPPKLQAGVGVGTGGAIATAEGVGANSGTCVGAVGKLRGVRLPPSCIDVWVSLLLIVDDDGAAGAGLRPGRRAAKAISPTSTRLKHNQRTRGGLAAYRRIAARNALIIIE